MYNYIWHIGHQRVNSDDNIMKLEKYRRDMDALHGDSKVQMWDSLKLV